MHWRTLHLVTGAAGLLLFVLTGQYMQHVANVPALDDAQRLMYRSLHLYLMGASAGNVLVGYYMATDQAMGFLRGAASVALIISPLLLAVSFFTETGTLDRVLASLGLYLLFGAAALLLIAEAWHRFRQD